MKTKYGANERKCKYHIQDQDVPLHAQEIDFNIFNNFYKRYMRYMTTVTHALQMHDEETQQHLPRR
jgi:hypothetical protein